MGDRGYEGDSGYLANLGARFGGDLGGDLGGNLGRDVGGDIGGDMGAATRRDRWDPEPWGADRRNAGGWDGRGWDGGGWDGGRDADRRGADPGGADPPDADPRDAGRWDADGRIADHRDADRREPAPPTPVPADDATAGVAERLLERLERHIWLLERLQAERLYPEPPGLAELQETARLMRRDTENILLLVGHEPEEPDSSPWPLGELVASGAAAVEDHWRVEVRPTPAAYVAPDAAVELQHVLAELVDHVLAAYPGARLELVSRLEDGLGGTGLIVDAIVDGAARHDPEGLAGRRAAAAAEQLAERSRHRIALHRPPSGPPSAGSGLIASVHCPAAAVTVPEPPRREPLRPPVSLREPTLREPTLRDFESLRPPEPARPDRWDDLGLAAYSTEDGVTAGRSNGAGAEGTNGLGYDTGGSAGNGLGSDSGSSAGSGLGYDGGSSAGSGFGYDGGSSAGNELGYDSGSAGSGLGYDGGSGAGNDLGYDGGSSAGNGLGYDTGNGSAPSTPTFDDTPSYSPSSSSQIDELFGPLIDLPLEPIDDRYATPIFEAIASAWFREDEGDSAGSGGGSARDPLDWKTPQDDEWREAAARAARSEPTPTTATGLPRRQPGNQLVPPPRSTSSPENKGPAERVPDRVRDRLGSYQRGLREGRHRSEGADRESW